MSLPLIGALAGLFVLFLVARLFRGQGVLTRRLDGSRWWVRAWSSFFMLVLVGIAAVEVIDLAVASWVSLTLLQYALVVGGVALGGTVVVMLIWGKKVDRTVRPLVQEQPDRRQDERPVP